MMKTLYNLGKILLVSGLFFMIGCGDDPEPGLPSQISADKPAPVINSIESDKPPLGGITVVTINGQNFSVNPEDIKVYFNGVKGTTISSTPNQVRVKIPLVIGDTVKVKIAAFKVENFSNEYILQILPGVEKYFNFNPDNGEIPYAITFDSQSNLFVSLEGLGVYRVTPTKILSQFVPKGAETKWDALRIFSNGDIYAAKNLRGIWRINQGVVPPNPPWGLSPAGTFLRDFDFDSNTNIWAVGNNNFIFRIKQDATAAQFAFIATLRAARVFNNFLYVAGVRSETEAIWRFPIDANGDLGAEELYFNLGAAYPGVRTNAMTFSQDGDLYLGTNQEPDPVIIVHPDKSSEVLYPGIIPASEIISMYYPAGNNLFITRVRKGTQYDQTVLRVDLQKPGAVYHNQ